MRKYCEECGRLFESSDVLKNICNDCTRDAEDSNGDDICSVVMELEKQQESEQSQNNTQDD
jgi:uncharacterized protein (DUF983 family)